MAVFVLGAGRTGWIGKEEAGRRGKDEESELGRFGCRRDSDDFLGCCRVRVL